MRPDISMLRGALEREGYCLVRGAVGGAARAELERGLATALASPAEAAASIRARSGLVYAARNLLELFPPVQDLWRSEVLVELVRAVLGAGAGLVRGLYFDKPPEQSWSLPWHKDLTIAVRAHADRSSRMTHPTIKAGVPHVEAPLDVLEQMLTLRVHLDAVTKENGPLEVLPGSHRSGREAAGKGPAVKVLCAAGDTLAMRPLVSHASGLSQAGTQQRRRVVHLEFAAGSVLPDGYEWRWWVPLEAGARAGG
jgi:hypothetical protein